MVEHELRDKIIETNDGLRAYIFAQVQANKEMISEIKEENRLLQEESKKRHHLINDNLTKINIKLEELVLVKRLVYGAVGLILISFFTLVVKK